MGREIEREKGVWYGEEPNNKGEEEGELHGKGEWRAHAVQRW